VGLVPAGAQPECLRVCARNRFDNPVNVNLLRNDLGRCGEMVAGGWGDVHFGDGPVTGWFVDEYIWLPVMNHAQSTRYLSCKQIV
jgi:hypothetical protein